MNRRGFFTRLGLLAGAASVSPTIFLPRFEAVHWKVVRPVMMGILGQEVYWMPFSAREFYGQWRWVAEVNGELRVL